MTEKDEPSALVGAVLDKRWRLVRAIGEGGLALVFEGVGTEDGRKVAVKLLRREHRDEPVVVERFLSEAAAGERVDHPGVVKVIEAARAEDGTPFLVMELVDGIPLAARMNQGPMPAAEVVPLLRSLLDALAAAHRAGVVHRDLKPDNVFLVAGPSGRPAAKLLDLGLARVMDVAGGMGRKTKTGMVLGTPGYMSPEQIRDAKRADHRCDLWSVGVMAYEMLTGRPAFPAETELARVTAVLTDEPTPIEEAAPQYSHWAGFFRRALARDVGERFQSAGELGEALDATSQGAMAAVTPPQRAPGAGPFGGTPTAISASMPGAVAAEPAPQVQVVAPVRRGVPPVVVVVVAVLAALGVGLALGVLFMLS